MSCTRAQGFLANAEAEIMEQVDSRKTKYGPADAIALARKVQHIYVARGKSFRHIDLKKDALTDEELVKLMVGPTGTLRAPTIQRGKELFVGFHADEYEARLAR